MALRDQFTEQLKAAMKGGDAPRVSTLRMIMAKLKDTDIAARPALEKVPDEQIVTMLRGMTKSRRESVELYKQGKRDDLVAKEEAEIAVIEAFRRNRWTRRRPSRPSSRRSPRPAPRPSRTWVR